MENLSDKELIAKYLKGDEGALAVIVKRYLPFVYALASRYTGDADNASDIVQETFVKAWRYLGKFDSEKCFKPWLLTIAKNTALDWLKKKKDTPFSVFEESGALEVVVDPSPRLDVAAENKETVGKIKEAVSKLPPLYRSVVSLRHEDDLKFREIAARLMTSINTVKSRYRRAVKILKNYLS